jgi:DNA segregation ATPase FtsK/SpoIIIE-like protein
MLNLFNRFRQETWTTPEGYTWNLCDDILKQTHCIIGGTSGSGKSTLLHSLMFSALIDSPVRVQFVLVDVKHGMELRRYKNLPHVLDFASTPEEAVKSIKYTEELMDRRYKEVLRTNRNSYDGSDIYLVIDELADLMQTAKAQVLGPLARIMRLGRAARVHVIGATQSPSRSHGGGIPSELAVNTGAALALRCRSSIESRQICGQGGAELLPEHGRGIYWSPSGTVQVDVPQTPEKDLTERINYWRYTRPRRRWVA